MLRIWNTSGRLVGIKPWKFSLRGSFYYPDRPSFKATKSFSWAHDTSNTVKHVELSGEESSEFTAELDHYRDAANKGQSALRQDFLSAVGHLDNIYRSHMPDARGKKVSDRFLSKYPEAENWESNYNELLYGFMSETICYLVDRFKIYDTACKCNMM